MEKNEKTWQPELSGQDLCIDLMFGQRHSTTCFFFRSIDAFEMFPHLDHLLKKLSLNGASASTRRATRVSSVAGSEVWDSLKADNAACCNLCLAPSAGSVAASMRNLVQDICCDSPWRFLCGWNSHLRSVVTRGTICVADTWKSGVTSFRGVRKVGHVHPAFSLQAVLSVAAH